MKKYLLSLLIILIFSSISLAETQDELIEVLENRFSTISSIQMDFTERSIPVIGEPLVFEGSLFISRPSNVRMEVSVPEEQLMVYDGTTAWLYIPREKYCVKFNSAENTILSRLPGYIFDPFKNLTIDTLFSDTNFIHTKLTSDIDKALFDWIEISISRDKLLPSSITLKDIVGNRTVYNFTTIEINSGKKVDFSFSPPESIEIIEQ
jgi:chaperone LolA